MPVAGLGQIAKIACGRLLLGAVALCLGLVGTFASARERGQASQAAPVVGEFKTVSYGNSQDKAAPRVDLYSDLMESAAYELTSPSDKRAISDYLNQTEVNQRVARLLTVMSLLERQLVALGWKTCVNEPPPSAKNGFTFAYVGKGCFVSAVSVAASWLDGFLSAPVAVQSVIYAYYNRTLRELGGDTQRTAKF